MYRVLDLFCGAGGFSLGFKMAGFEICGGIDIKENFKKTYEKNINAPYIVADIRDLNAQKIYNLLDLKESEIDVVIGGPPCQGFSIANTTRRSSDDRNQLVIEFINMVSNINPKFFVMENVVGLKNMEGGKVLQYIINQFKKTQYHFKHPKILNALGFGVPQRRRRLFFIGYLKKEWKVSFPTEEFYTKYVNVGKDSFVNLNSFLFHKKRRDKKTRTVYDAFGDLPNLKENKTSTNYKTKFKNLTNDYQI